MTSGARTTGSAPSEQAAKYLELVDLVSDHWARLVRPHGSLFSARREDVNNAFAILGLSTHALRLAPEIATLLRTGRVWMATPLVRLALECALKAQWIRHVPDGFAAFASEGLRQRRNLIDAIERSVLRVDGPIVDFDQDPALAWLDETTSNAGAKQFRLLCDDLEPGGSTYYAIYRLLSATSHASVNLVDEYFIANPGSPDDMPTYVPGQARASEAVLAYTSAASAVWAGRAVGMALKQDAQLKQFRATVRRAARVLQTEPELRISEDAWRRVHSAVR